MDAKQHLMVFLFIFICSILSSVHFGKTKREGKKKRKQQTHLIRESAVSFLQSYQ